MTQLSGLVVFRFDLRRKPHQNSIKIMGAVERQSAANTVNVHPGPIRVIINCTTASPAADKPQRTMLEEACAVAGFSGCRSVSRVPHMLKIHVIDAPTRN